MDLGSLQPAAGSRRPRKRIGRGEASGQGETAGRGHKGYGSRSGWKKRRGYEGGQMPLHRRLPKFGFTNIFRRTHEVVNVGALQRFDAQAVVDKALLHTAGLISKPQARVKILGDGEVTVALTVHADAFSQSAAAKIEQAGGQIVVA